MYLHKFNLGAIGRRVYLTASPPAIFLSLIYLASECPGLPVKFKMCAFRNKMAT